MNGDNFEALLGMLSEFEQEQYSIKQNINSNLIKIHEAECYIRYLQELDDKEFKFFSPRAIRNNINKEEMEKYKEEIVTYEEKNRVLQNKYDECSSRIERLNKIIQDEKDYNLTILSIQEEERHRISRDLHDTSLQTLTYLVHKIELSSKFIDQDSDRAKLELSIVNKNLRAVIDEIRSSIFNLRPMSVDDLGLKATFERLVSVLNNNNKFEVDMQIEDVSCEKNLLMITLYRTVQECLSNVSKHSEATKIIFHGKLVDGIYHIVIEDNGKGFDMDEVVETKKDHFGLALMKERMILLGGNIKFISEIGKGTRIEINIPLS